MGAYSEVEEAMVARERAEAELLRLEGAPAVVDLTGTGCADLDRSPHAAFTASPITRRAAMRPPLSGIHRLLRISRLVREHPNDRELQRRKGALAQDTLGDGRGTGGAGARRQQLDEEDFITLFGDV